MSYNNIIEIRNFRPINTLHCKHLLYILRFFLFFLPFPPEKSCLKPLSDHPPALLLIISRPFSRSVPVAFFSLKKIHTTLRKFPQSSSIFPFRGRLLPLFADVSCSYLRKVPAVFAQGGIPRWGPCAQNLITRLLAHKVSPLFFHLARPGVAEAQIAHFHQLRPSAWEITS